jgi:hypothetical protein
MWHACEEKGSRVLVGNLKERGHMKFLSIYKRIILYWILQN